MLLNWLGEGEKTTTVSVRLKAFTDVLVGSMVLAMAETQLYGYKHRRIRILALLSLAWVCSPDCLFISGIQVMSHNDASGRCFDA